MGVKLLGLLLICSLPLRQLRLTSGYGYRLHPVIHRVKLHTGIDLAAHHDTVFAVLDGLVDECRYSNGLGIYIRLGHFGGLNSIYGHLSQWLVLPGDSVKAGDSIGITGATGLVTGEHLHFALSYKRHYIDPLRFLKRMVIDSTKTSSIL